jgi:hypothetical protein
MPGLASSRSTWLAVLTAAGLALPACVEQNADMPSEEEIKAAREHVLTTAPTPKHVVNANLEDKLTYLGLDVDVDEVQPGKAFTLTHYWKVNNPVGDDWKIFVHLESPGGKKSHLNADHVPISGKYPVSLWKKGEIIRDIHRVSIPASWPSDKLELYVGAWKGPLRLKVTSGPKDAENRVPIATLPVVGAQKEAAKKRVLVARKVKNGTIKVDGKLDEAIWKEAPSTGAFVRTMDGGKADQETTARVLWDDKNLYVAFELEDKDVWTTLNKHDDKLWTQEAVEMFIDADGDGKTYVELQVNPKGATFDSWLPSYRKNENDWDPPFKAAVTVDGTVDNRGDADKGWVVEMAVPLDAPRGKEKEMKGVPPTIGTEWRVNFFRMDLPQGRPQSGTAWSPPMVGDFHALAQFGVLAFGDDKGTPPAGDAKGDKKDAKADKGDKKDAKDGKKDATKTEAPAEKADGKSAAKAPPAPSEDPAQAAKRKARTSAVRGE